MSEIWSDQEPQSSHPPDSLWRRSYTGQLMESMQKRANAAWIRLCGGMDFGIRWPGLIEGFIILGVVFMPVLSSWELLPPLLLLLWITGPVKSIPGTGPGWMPLWFVLLVSAFFSPGFGNGFPVLLRFGSWFVLAWLIGRTFPAAMNERILKYLVYTSLLWLIIGFWQLFSGIPTPRGWLGTEQAGIIPVRIYSVFGNPNIFALYLLSILAIGRYRMAKCIGKAERCLLTGILLLVLAALYFTYTRMAWLLAAMVWVIQSDKKRWRLNLLVAGIAVSLLLILPGFKLRLGSLADIHDSSLQYRIQVWRGTGTALKDFWLWGSGPGSFQAVYPQYQTGRNISQHAHQLFLQFWLEHGLFSLLAFLAVLKKVLTGGGAQGASPAMKTLAMVLIMFLVYGFSETWYVHRFSGGYFWFLTGLLQASERANMKGISSY
jgi:O-antigen ligase